MACWLGWTAGCAKQQQIQPGNVADPLIALRAGPPLAADRVWPLEMKGTSPVDTTVRFSARGGRTIILRQGPPDNAIFAILEIPPDTSAVMGDTLQLGVRPLPATFGFELITAGPVAKGAFASFSFAMHFSLPSDAIATYPTPTRFDKMLSAARYTPDGKIQFLPSERTAADIIRFPLTTPGRYLLVAPK